MLTYIAMCREVFALRKKCGRYEISNEVLKSKRVDLSGYRLSERKVTTLSDVVFTLFLSGKYFIRLLWQGVIKIIIKIDWF